MEIQYKNLKIFGPAVLKVRIPDEITKKLNDYIDEVVKDKEKSKNLNLGEYLAGDVGYTFEANRRFDNGVEFSAFYSKTDVSAELFGEGSFDKGVKLKIPFNLFSSSKNLGYYVWRPLTKDPAAMLVRSNKLEDLIERYRVN